MSRPVGIEVRGWGWRHAGRRAWAVRDVSLRIEPGERVLLLGPSGAGKSTLLLALAGLLETAGGAGEAGSLLLDGRRPAEARDRTGIVFQDPETQIVMGKAGDDVAFGLENRCVPSEAIWPRVDAALRTVGFDHARDRATSALSGGEKQRLALAGILALAPGLLLLDEPTANLDPDGCDRLWRTLRDVGEQGETTMVLVEHRVEAALPLVDRVVVLSPGDGIVADGAPLEVFRRHATALADAGVWVPGARAAPPPHPEGAAHETLVLAEEATFRYPGEGRPALERTSVGLRSSEVVAVTGPNGAGKTTLALLLGGLVRPSGGEVVAGEALAAGHAHEAIAGWRAEQLVGAVGSVFQEPEHQFLANSVRAELEIGPRRLRLPAAETTRRVHDLLDRLHLAHLAEANPYTLSGGEKRRLSVATALATAPSVLVLDEPTFGQDRRTWGEMLALLAALRTAGRAICVVTHDREFATALADRTLRLAPPVAGSA